MQGARRVACYETTASRPSTAPVPSSPDPGTSHLARHDVRAGPAASLRGCRTPLHRSVVLKCVLASNYRRSTGKSQQSAGLLTPQNQATTTTDCCSFEMIRASFQQEWASQG